MFPIALDLNHVTILLIGNDEKALRRLQQLSDTQTIYADAPIPALRDYAGARLIERLPTEEEITSAQILMIVGLDEARAIAIATRGRELGKLVNIEDNTPWCDFHYPAMVKRGDLLLTVSTGGRSPTLSRSIREKLEKDFGPEWAEYTEDIGAKRDAWRANGLSFKDVMHESKAYIAQKGWLKKGGQL